MNYPIIAYTDGACKGNGKQGTNAGGFGTHIVFANGDILDIWGGESDTTNNRMELMGAITALERTPANLPLQIWTDSSYVKDGISKWIKGWKAKGWKKSDGKAVLNQDLWIRLDTACQNRHIDWQWIKGHAGHMGNEQADKLANQGVLGAGELFIPNPNPANTHTLNQPLTNDSTSAFIKYSSSEMTMNNDDFNPNIHEMNFDDIDNEMSDVYFYDDMNANDFYHHANEIAHDDNITHDNTTSPHHTKKSTPTALVRHDQQNPDYDGRTDEIREPFWAVLPDPINQNKPERQLIMDTETTGFDPATGDRIVEIGIVEMVKRKPTGVQLHVYLNPDKEMDEEVIKVHGIHNQFLVDKPRFADVAPFVYEFMKGAEIIAHNAPFDMKFLISEFDKVGLSDFAEVVQVTDSLMIARKIFAGQKNSLDALSKRLDVGQEIDRSYHGALKDSQILLEVYLAMTSGQMKMDMEEEQTLNDEGGGVIEFRDLSALAGQLIYSKEDWQADGIWRENLAQSNTQ